MTPPASSRLQRYLDRRLVLDDPFVELDLGHALLDELELGRLDAPLQQALRAMQALEAGAIANRDEQRQVGHYWLRAPGLAPDEATQQAIVETLARCEQFAHDVHHGVVAPPRGGRFASIVLCGIGGSALGPALLGDAFGGPGARLRLVVLDNTDPEGIDRALHAAAPLATALVLVVSKSGGTPETRSAMLEVQRAFAAAGLEFARHAVAITADGSKLHATSQRERWLASLPMWDWVGGRTSITSAVGLLPGALLGLDVRALLAGAAAMDGATRLPWRQNPAAMLAAFWHQQGHGRG
jgi:glucose-6-phosphate isomerase